MARGDRGQATVEFLGLFPLLVAVLVAIWQGTVLAMTFILAGHAAAAGARAAAVHSDARVAALRDLPAGWRDGATVRLEHWISASGGEQELRAVSVDLSVPLLFPGLWRLPLHASGRAGVLEEAGS
ncbi:TadE-like protein [Streptomyces sp. TLI_235]|nr:TadE/TadG family type IV pilus assembly protein [Streptomyces sp. TLI_235]PBC69582.1 TadE-like protein [Streptomyces sp. TLI_235]